MKVLLVITKGELGGATKRIIDLATAYQKAGAEVVVASGPGEYLPAELSEREIEHVCFQNLSRANPLKIIAYIFQLWSFLRRRDFDVVHLNSSSALAGAPAAKLAGAKAVFTFRGLSILAPGYQASALKRWFFRASYQLFLPFVDVGVFQCEANRKAAHEMGVRVKKERVIRDGINVERLNFLPRSEARQRLGEMTGADLAEKKVIGSIGRLSYQKNYEFLVRLMPKVLKSNPEVVCIIIGDGPERARLEGEIERLGLEESVYLVGEHTGAAELLRGFDAFTLVSRYEGLSMTLTEALHAGAVMLVSRVGAAPEVVASDQMLFSPGDAAEFTAKLGKLLEASDSQDLKGQIRARADELVLENSAKEYLGLYQTSVR